MSPIDTNALSEGKLGSASGSPTSRRGSQTFGQPIYAIGDVHGCYDQLLVLLAKIRSHAGRQAYRGVFLGDYVDRGPKSREVVNQIKGLVCGRGGHGKWTALKGNHEEMMVCGAKNILRDFGKHVVYGHTPHKEPKLMLNSSGLDTGAFRGGPLTAGVFTAPGGPSEILCAA